MVDRIDVAIIGAGPYGLSAAAHLRAAGVEFRIFGKTMDSWKNGMPPGMLLKSAAWSSDLSDPQGKLTLGKYCAEKGVAYDHTRVPVNVETFVAYGEEFQRRFVPNVEDRKVDRLARDGAGYRLTFEDGDELIAQRVVLAVGAHPFKRFPKELQALPADRLSHSADYGNIDALAGKEVAVIGSGASATDLAALLQEHGAKVTLIARTRALEFQPVPQPPSFFKKLTQPLYSLLAPESGLGRGWKFKLWADAPWTFHILPESTRRRVMSTVLGPLGQAMMRDRVIGKVRLFLGHSLAASRVRLDKAELDIAGADGQRRTVAVDHVLACTGYVIDLRKLPMLDPALLKQMKLSDGEPVLSLDYETSVPGLYLIGAASMGSFGHASRFVAGVPYPARKLARIFAAAPRRQAAASGYRAQPAAAAE